MALRQLPFSITCRNFLFNIKHYKPLRCRPSFRASNHPFCTNRQLLEASYSQWILRATRDIAPKILKEASRNTDSPRNDKGIEDNRFLNVVASATGGTNVLSHVQNPQSLPLDDSFFECNDDHKTGSSGRNISRFDHTSDLIRGKNIASIVEELILSNNKEAIAQSDILNTIVNEVLRQAPPKSLIENNNEIDVPFNQSHKNPEHLSSFYTYIYGKIPHLYNLFHTYEPYMRNSKTFQENYIWLCYHMNDIDSIQEIAFTYFGNQSYNSKTLSYIMSGFILNYEVEFSKNLFSNLISLGRPMEPVLLDVVVSSLVQVDSLFETLTFVLSKWRDSKICSPPSPKAMALLSTEYAKYGTAEEIHNLNDVVATSASPDHFLIKLAQLKNNIKSRDPNNFKKRILDSDLSTINLISEDINNSSDLTLFYFDLLNFFIKYSDMKMIQFVFLKMKHYNIKPSEEFFLLVSKYYASEGKFLPLLQFLESSCSKTKFNYVYVKLLFQSLVDSYPYYALEFKSNFDSWVKMNPAISVQMQDLLQNSFKIKKLDSQITPFALYRNLLCSKKYDSTNWQKLEWKHDKSGKIINCTEQINYRINKGFKDVLRKGVRPDLKIIENTFRRSNFDNRQKIIHLLKMIRMYDRIENKLNVYDLQLKPDKQKLKSYFHNVSWSKLNSYHLLTLSRLFMNKRLYYETEEILKCIRPEEMSSRSLMIKWNIQMRNCLFYSRFDEMKSLIDDFRLDEVTLSPYLYKQCCHIEKLLINKLNALKKKEYLGGAEASTRDGKILNQTRILDMLKQLRGFIGDVDIRLTEDKIEIRAKVHEMFKFLDSWLHSDRSNDNRLL